MDLFLAQLCKPACLPSCISPLTVPVVCIFGGGAQEKVFGINTCRSVAGVTYAKMMSFLHPMFEEVTNSVCLEFNSLGV